MINGAVLPREAKRVRALASLVAATSLRVICGCELAVPRLRVGRSTGASVRVVSLGAVLVTVWGDLTCRSGKDSRVGRKVFSTGFCATVLADPDLTALVPGGRTSVPDRRSS